MRIDAYNQIGQVYKTNNKLKTQKTSGATRSDHVEISEFGKVLQTAKQELRTAGTSGKIRLQTLRQELTMGLTR